jgi:hypothetical protein
VITASMQVQPLPGSNASAAMIATVTAGKYVDGYAAVPGRSRARAQLSKWEVITPNLKDCAIAVVDGSVVRLKQTAASASTSSATAAAKLDDEPQPAAPPGTQAALEASFDCK